MSNFLWKLEDVAGLRGKYKLLYDGKYKGINRKVKYTSDLKSKELELLPYEAHMSIKYLNGRPYSRSEIKLAEKEFVKPNFVNYEICGSYRRKSKQMKDMDILTTDHPLIKSNRIILIRNGEIRTKLLFKLSTSRYIPIDIFYTTKESWIFSLLHLTGSANFNIQLRREAIKKGYKLNEYGLYKNNKSKRFKTEREIIEFLTGKYYSPINRSK